MQINERTTDTATVTLASGIDVELELPQKPDSIMMYKDSVQHQQGDKLLVGYLVHDSDCTNPLEDDEGMGLIYTARRHSPDLDKFFEALGLDREGNPDLSLVDTHLVSDEADDDELLELWKQGRNEGTIGNKYAVSLDVYEHGGVAYSLSGQGMQCQFDTARGGALWVPTGVCLEEIKLRGPVYQKGKIVTSSLRTKQQYNVRTYEKFGLFDQVVHPPFETRYEAYTYLKNLEGVTYLQPLYDAEFQAAQELAKTAAEVYTQWCNGNCYGYVIATYIIDSDVEEGDTIECEESQSCYGYVGDDNAYESLKEEFDSWKQSL